MYGPNQVGEIIIGNAVATETTIATFVTAASDKELAVLKADGGNVPTAQGDLFRLVQKTAGDASKNLNVEYSDIIDPRYVERVTLKAYAPEIQKSVTVTVGSAVANTTYEIAIRLYNDGGSLSPENFAIIQGFYVTGSSAETITAIRDGLLSSLNKNLAKRGNFEFVVAASSTNAITITGKAQTTVPGKIIGYQIQWDIATPSYSNVYDATQPSPNNGLLTYAETAQNYPGSGTYKQVANYEWFVKGIKYDPARQVGYPVDFDTPYYATSAGIYNLIDVIYYTPRKETSVERQYKVLTIAVDKVTNTNAANAATNDILGYIRTAVGTYATVPADLVEV